MKKILICMICLALTVGLLAGCSGGGKKVEGTLDEILERIYGAIPDSFELPFLSNLPLTEAGTEFNPNIKYFIGVEGLRFTEGLVSEPAISGGYSVVLLRMERDADVGKAKTDIKDNVDPAKWICYQADFVVTDNIGDLLILIMTNEEHNPGLGQAVHDAFLGLA